MNNLFRHKKAEVNIDLWASNIHDNIIYSLTDVVCTATVFFFLLLLHQFYCSDIENVIHQKENGVLGSFINPKKHYYRKHSCVSECPKMQPESGGIPELGKPVK